MSNNIIKSLTDILDNVYYLNQEKIRKELYMCKGNCNNKKSDKCFFNKCKNCCKDIECLYHKNYYINKKNKALEYKQLHRHTNKL